MSDPILTFSTDDLAPLFEIAQLAITTFGALFIAWVSYKQAKLAKTVDDLHGSTNSKMDQLLRVVAESAEAKGILVGRAAERRESADRNV